MGRKQLILALSQPRSGCVRVRAGSALLCPGPLWRGGWVEESPQDGPQGCGPVFRRYMDVPSENPVARPRTRSPWMGGGRAIGVAFLFGSFLFGHSKRKELGHRQVDETALNLARARKQEPPSPQPSPPTMLGERGTSGRQPALSPAVCAIQAPTTADT